MDTGHERIISSFRNAQEQLRNSEAFSADGKHEMNQMIEGCIKALKQEGRVGFVRTYRENLSHHPDGFGEVLDMLFDELGMETLDELKTLL